MNILIYDKYPVIRIGLSQVVKNKIKNSEIFFAGSIDQVFHLSFKIKFDLVIADIEYEEVDNFFLISKFILMFSFKSKFLFFSENNSKIFYKKCNDRNIFAMSKNSTDDEICNKIDECFNNRITNRLSLSKVNDEINTVFFQNKANILSARELQYTSMMLQGYTNIEIANKLNLSATTISTYKKRVLRKTKTNNVVELTRFFG